MIQALVPLKDLVEAKSRLSGLLRPSERRALAQAMVEDVLAALRDHEELDNITLVSDDPGANLLAQKYAADCWPERRLGCRGLNPLIHRATQILLQSCDEPLMVLHADLPLLGKADIDAVLNAMPESGGLAIGCDRQSRGTNLLFFDASSVPQFAFGIGSCEKHLQCARKLGTPVRLVRSEGVALDVDEPSDLAHLMPKLGSRPTSHTAQLLLDTALGRRVQAVLAMQTDSVEPADGGGARC
ncbi:MAG: 2-phospho-L-lactate guanylyltransferase [Halioglobus sp.]|nr:2-phospho-L-lactate guanylyltransferase [Halioglobus sp.]